jgi:hypothetical protein
MLVLCAKLRNHALIYHVKMVVLVAIMVILVIIVARVQLLILGMIVKLLFLVQVDRVKMLVFARILRTIVRLVVLVHQPTPAPYAKPSSHVQPTHVKMAVAVQTQ